MSYHLKCLYFIFLNVIKLSLAAEHLIISNAGIFDVKEGDIAIIFYVTIENESEKDTSISVSMNKCCDQTHTTEENSCDPMYLIGGYMGILKSKQAMNATLIYPNMYTSFRQGTCSIIVSYGTNKHNKILTKVINFRTNNSAEDSEQNQCATVDLDPQDNCNRVDCVMKYSGERNYFNPVTKECEHVPVCLSDSTNVQYTGYSWITNQCINLKDYILPSDIEFLDNNQAEITDDMSMYQINKICHRSETDSSNNANCICANGWRTTLSEDDVYEPSLLLYHMCNVETGAWNCVNKTKIQTTILIITILVVTIASKLLIVMCILSWCYKHFRKSKVVICTDEEHDDYRKFLIDDQLEGQDRCICTTLRENVKSSSLHKQTVDISYFPGKTDYNHITPQTSRSRAKEKEYSINLGQSTTTSNDEGTTENDGNEAITKSLDPKTVVGTESQRKVTQPEEETETTDYSIQLSNTTSTNAGMDHTGSTETEEYAVDFTKTEEKK